MTTFQAQQKPSARFIPVQSQSSTACVQDQSCRASHEQIERRAYEIYVGNGRQEGHGEADWFQAERQLATDDADAPDASSKSRLASGAG